MRFRHVALLHLLLLVVGPALAHASDPTHPGLDEAREAARNAWAARTVGANGPLAQTTAADEAVTAWRRVLESDPDDVDARWNLIRAIFYRAVYTGADRDQRRDLLAEARDLAEAPLEARQPKALKSAELHFWASAVWGEWALAFGKLAAARQGAAGRIRELAEQTIELDPRAFGAGGHRVLGRLHDQSPKIPFLTGWVDRDLAVSELETAVNLADDEPSNLLFLAEALLEHRRSATGRAQQMLRRCATMEPRPDLLVEDRHYSELCRQRLKK